jgi:magnesium chelatase family protein
MVTIVKSFGLQGIDGFMVDVEVDIGEGLPHWDTVGLPDEAVKESKERVQAAIKNSGIEFKTHRIIINLAPASTKKEGPAFDFPIAIGILASSSDINRKILDDYAFLG